MSGLFSRPAAPQIVTPPPPPPPPPPKIVVPEMPKPRPVRMPIGEDPNAEKAAQMFRRRAAQRKGRQSTILTGALREMTGSSGQSLGG